MKNTLLIIALLFSAFSFAQSKKLDKREQELSNILKKSHYSKKFPLDYNHYVSKKYACLEKYYKVNPLEQKEFLSKKEFNKNYPFYDPMHYKSIENASLLEETLKIEHWNKNTKTNEIFPKCFNKSDIDWELYK